MSLRSDPVALCRLHAALDGRSPACQCSPVPKSVTPTIARWLYNSGPTVRRVFIVVPEGGGVPGEPHQSKLVVVRTDVNEPRAVFNKQMASSFWEIPESEFARIESGECEPPPGFARSTWQPVSPPEPRRTTIHIERIALENVRCFGSADITLKPGLNLFIGNNGAGKTTVLDALAHVFQQVTTRLDPLAHVVLDVMAPKVLGAPGYTLLTHRPDSRRQHRTGHDADTSIGSAPFDRQPAVPGILQYPQYLCPGARPKARRLSILGAQSILRR